MTLSKDLREKLLRSAIPFTPENVNGTWNLVPEYSDSLKKLYDFLRPGNIVKGNLMHLCCSKSISKNVLELSDRIFRIKSISHGFSCHKEEILVNADYEQISNSEFEGKGTKITKVVDNTVLVTETKAKRGTGKLERRIVKVEGGKMMMILDYDWTNRSGKRLAITRVFVRKSNTNTSPNSASRSSKEVSVMLVVGGSGFLGQHLVDHILTKDWEARIRIFDIRPPQKEIVHPRVEFFQGDITKLDDLVKACEDVHTIFHTASPPEGRGRKLYELVNVLGTNNVIEAAKIAKVEQIVFTSTASVVFDGTRHIVNGDESIPYVTKYLDPYIETKIQAEKAILAANSPTLRTCAIRPSGIFGPGDAQAWPGIIEAGKKKQSKYQLGNNKNLMDWTYVENVAHAHCIAAEKLALHDSGVGGEAFFITNNEPLPFWEMPKYVWSSLGYPLPRIVIPAFLILAIAWLLDWIVFILSPIVTIKPSLTYFRVVLATTSRSFSCEKAQKLLGYEPTFSLAEGMAKTLEYFRDKEQKQ